MPPWRRRSRPSRPRSTSCRRAWSSFPSEIAYPRPATPIIRDIVMQRFLGTWEGTCPSRRCPAPTDSGLRSFASTSRRGCRGIRHPQLGADGVLEWWTSQQGMVTSYAALSADAQQALLRAYDAHLATLDGLIEAMRARGLAEQAGQIERCARRRRWTDCTASTGDCWCACNRILSPTHHRGGAQRAAGALVARGAGRPAPSGGDACRAVVVVQASRGAAVRCGRCSRARARARTGACACAGARIKTRTSQSQSPSPNEIPSGLRSSPLSWKRRIA